MQNKIPFTFILLSACQVDYELTGGVQMSILVMY